MWGLHNVPERHSPQCKDGMLTMLLSAMTNAVYQLRLFNVMHRLREHIAYRNGEQGEKASPAGTPEACQLCCW